MRRFLPIYLIIMVILIVWALSGCMGTTTYFLSPTIAPEIKAKPPEKPADRRDAEKGPETP